MDAEIICQYRCFLELPIHPSLLSLALSILGWNIQLGYLGLTINPPQNSNKKGLDWHQDGGRVNFDLTHPTNCRLTVKFAIWLTDGSCDGRGNFYLVPKSHTSDKAALHELKEKNGEVGVFIEPGDAIAFDRRVWHSRKANLSNENRKVIFIDYSHRWMEPKCRFNVPSEFIHILTPIQLQLFDYYGTDWRSYAPREIESPLKKYMAMENINLISDY